MAKRGLHTKVHTKDGEHFLVTEQKHEASGLTTQAVEGPYDRFGAENEINQLQAGIIERQQQIQLLRDRQALLQKIVDASDPPPA